MENSPPLDEASHPMRLLAAGVPLSLLLDLASPSGRDSRWIASTEQRVTAA
jgi:hypothetical protein